MTASKTVFELFLNASSNAGKRPALVHPQLVLTYEDLATSVLGFAQSLVRHGVEPGTKVALVSRALTTNLNMVLAVSAIGGTFVHAASSDPSSAPPTDLTFFSREPGITVPATGIEIDGDWIAATGGLPSAKALATHPALVGQAADGSYIEISPTDLAARANAFLFGTPSPLHWASTLAPTQLAFLERALACLISGGTIVTTTDPDFWMRARATMVTGNSGALSALLSSTPASSLQMADLIDEVLDVELASLLGKVPTVRQVYSPLAVGPALVRLTRESGHDTRVVAARVDIVDQTFQPVAVGQVGAVRIETADGKKVLPGDVGYLTSAGDLILVAHSRDNAIIGGLPINLRAVEAEMTAIEGIRSAVAFRNPKQFAPDEIFAYLVLEEGFNASQLKELARNRVGKKFGSSTAPRVIQTIAEVPRGPDGSTDRVACAALILKLAANRRAEA